MVLAFHKWRTCMTKLKLLSAALIATAMIATPAMARTNNVTSRHLVEDANASIAPGARNSDERHCHFAPRVGAFATQPWENGPPCEPSLGY
jgi:hypothetical protein